MSSLSTGSTAWWNHQSGDVSVRETSNRRYWMGARLFNVGDSRLVNSQKSHDLVVNAHMCMEQMFVQI